MVFRTLNSPAPMFIVTRIIAIAAPPTPRAMVLERTMDSLSTRLGRKDLINCKIITVTAEIVALRELKK